MISHFTIKDERVRQNCINTIAALDLDKYEVSIKRKRKSNAQRKYWHMCMKIISDETGGDDEELKFEIKHRVLGGKQWIGMDGKVYETVISSEKLNVQQYSKLISATLSLADELGYVMPDPTFYGIELNEKKRGNQ